MVKSLKVLFSRIVDIGINLVDIHEIPYVRLMNGLALICIITTTLTGTLLSFIEPLDTIFFNCIIHIPIFILMLIVSHYKPLWTKWIFVIYINLTIFLWYYTMPYSAAFWSFYIALFVFYVAVFRKRIHYLILSLLSTSNIIIVAYYQSMPTHTLSQTYPKDQILGIQMSLFVAGIVLALLLTNFIKSNLVVHQKKLEQSLKEREILLKEVHHRVKNNLQTIYALLNLQNRRIDDEPSKQALESSQARIQSMALIHEQLYKSNDLKNILLESYINNLTTNIFIAYSKKKDEITINKSIDNISLELNTLIPLGLVINEILTNTLKHVSRDNCKIDIELKKNEKSGFSLSITDNGDGFDYTTSKKGLGLQIIEDMVHQINGSHILTSNSHGTSHLIISN